VWIRPCQVIAAYFETFFGRRISKYESLQGFILLSRVLWKIIEIIGTNDLAAKASKRKIKQLGIKTSQEKLKMAKDAANEKVTKAKNALQKAQKPDPVN